VRNYEIHHTRSTTNSTTRPGTVYPISLNKLSTELDENIVRRLARPELDALSRTSKYYRSLTEPYLYRNLVFSKHQAYEIQCLFLTILGRNELAKHIRSFTFTKDEVDMRALIRQGILQRDDGTYNCGHAACPNDHQTASGRTVRNAFIQSRIQLSGVIR
jgi:hypothetical protein